ncbi:hypothetical protein J6590_035546 [Homalodisca vitripennis]|nr:hypothetical protein J6590_035546 [Homalodisca vitripennis]
MRVLYETQCDLHCPVLVAYKKYCAILQRVFQAAKRNEMTDVSPGRIMSLRLCGNSIIASSVVVLGPILFLLYVLTACRIERAIVYRWAVERAGPQMMDGDVDKTADKTCCVIPVTFDPLKTVCRAHSNTQALVKRRRLSEERNCNWP